MQFVIGEALRKCFSMFSAIEYFQKFCAANNTRGFASLIQDWLIQELKPTDHSQRRQFLNWFLQYYEVNQHFGEEIIVIRDEAHLYLDWYFNKQNGRIWGFENSEIDETTSVSLILFEIMDLQSMDLVELWLG